MNLNIFIPLFFNRASFTFYFIKFSPSNSTDLYNSKFISSGGPSLCIPVLSSLYRYNKASPLKSVPTLHPHAVFFSPLGSKFTGEGFMKDGGFASFKAIQRVLRLLFGLVQFGKQAFNAINNAMLFRQRRQRKFVRFNDFLRDVRLCPTLAFLYKIIFLRACIIKKILIVY